MGVVCGGILGLILKQAHSPWTPREVMYVKFPGDLFLRTLKALILPLIFSSLVSAIGSLDLSMSKKIGVRALLYYGLTTACAVTLGIIMVSIVRPGVGAERTDSDPSCTASNTSNVDTLMDLVRNVFPPNLVEATMMVSQTGDVDPLKDDDPKNDNASREFWPVKTKSVNGMNLMGLVFFAAVLGVVLGKLREKGKALLDVFVSLSEAIMILTSIVVWFSPIAICSLIAGQLCEQKGGGGGGMYTNIGWYLGTVLTGLMIHGLIVVPSIFFLATRSLPFRFIANMSSAIFTALGTASSSATLPVTINCLEQNNKVDERVSRFVLPIGATINMDGTALYLPVGAIYIAQLCGFDLSLGHIISISLISTTTSIGAAGIPQIGMVIMLTVLNSVGLPGEYIAAIMPVDWILERFRTAVNIMGDSFGAGLVHHLSKADLAKIPQIFPLEHPSHPSNEKAKAEENDLQV
jgi:Na+/H+-dicarboxylate symporter